MSKRDFCVVVFGATGFTGKLCAEYLAESRGLSKTFRWAIAGRNQSKLENVKADLVRLNDECSDLDIIVADSADEGALKGMCSRTSVVLSTVGPFLKYGEPLVKACVESGTHYCDITGEPQFVRKLHDKYFDQAKKKGVRIVNCAGFDSIPSDLGTFLVANHFRDTHNTETKEVQGLFGPLKGTASGGTIHTMLNIFSLPRKEVMSAVMNPYYLNPDKRFKGPDTRDQNGIGRAHGMWTAPFVMASVNTRIVRRSNALLGFQYGQNMKYSEVMSFRSFIPAFMVTCGLMFTMICMQFGFLRSIFTKFVPAPGEGPSEAERLAGHFTATFYGEDTAQHKAIAKVKHNRDPGYGSTALMLSETACCLALDKLDTPTGIVTPASGCGIALVNRLRDAGYTLEVKDA